MEIGKRYVIKVWTGEELVAEFTQGEAKEPYFVSVTDETDVWFLEDLKDCNGVNDK